MASNNRKNNADSAKAGQVGAQAADKGKKAKAAAGAKPAKPTAKAAVKEKSTTSPAQWWPMAVQFLREVRTELKKVVWPSRKQTMASTSVVVVLVLIVSVFLGMVDYILSRIVGYVIG